MTGLTRFRTDLCRLCKRQVKRGLAARLRLGPAAPPPPPARSRPRAPPSAPLTPPLTRVTQTPAIQPMSAALCWLSRLGQVAVPAGIPRRRLGHVDHAPRRSGLVGHEPQTSGAAIPGAW